jgi:membrane-bound ClpP family serine protease
LGEADFGNWRNQLMMLFGAIAVLSYYFVPDFLAVRGVCICFLLGATEMLNSAFALYDIPARLFLVFFAYILIVLAIYLAVAPYRARDFNEWLFQTQGRPKFIGGVVFAYGLVLSISAFTY